MKTLTIDSFVSGESDVEINQYKILSRLKEYRNEFNKNKLYPSLSELVFLSSQLEDILNKKDNFLLQVPKKRSGQNAKSKSLFFDVADQVVEYEDYVYELIEWALPQIRSLIDEAYVIYEFVEDYLAIREVGVSPIYKDEGYLFVHNNGENIMQVHKYRNTVYSSENTPYHSLKTTFIEKAQIINTTNAPELLKDEIIKRSDDRPNYATFVCDTDLDFPFDETIFPVAKRKLLSILTEM